MEGLDEVIGDGMVDAMVSGDGEDVFWYFPLEYVINLCKSHNSFVLKSCGGGWNVVKSRFWCVYPKTIVVSLRSWRICMHQRGQILGHIVVVFVLLALWVVYDLSLGRILE